MPGLEVALVSGSGHAAAGGVKNVTDCDLAKLCTGPLGALGVIEAAWLRLRPLPEAASVAMAARVVQPVELVDRAYLAPPAVGDSPARMSP